MVWQPAHKDHAIERVALSFHFTEAVPTRVWSAISDRAAKTLSAAGYVAAQRGEPAKSRAQPVLEFSIAPGGAITVGDGAPPRIYTKHADDGLFEQVNLTRTQISFIATRYSGWSDFRDQALEMIAGWVGEALAVVPLRVLKLEYWDRFVFEGNPPDYRALFNAKSKHVPAFGLATSELWHAHSGYFTPSNEEGRYLVNVNLDMLDLPMPSIASEAGPEVRRSAGIYTMMEHHVANADIVPDCDSARPKFESMHKELKALCGDIVAIEIADRIGLNKRA